jgi:hypothetical protein
VKDVKRLPGSPQFYIIETGHDWEVPCKIEMFAGDDQVNKLIEAIGPNSSIEIRGQLAGVEGGDLIVRPAILFGGGLSHRIRNKLADLHRASEGILDFSSLEADIKPDSNRTTIQQEKISSGFKGLKGRVVHGVFDNYKIEGTSDGCVLVQYDGSPFKRRDNPVCIQIFVPLLKEAGMRDRLASIIGSPEDPNPITFRGFLSEVKSGFIRVEPAVFFSSVDLPVAPIENELEQTADGPSDPGAPLRGTQGHAVGNATSASSLAELELEKIKLERDRIELEKEKLRIEGQVKSETGEKTQGVAEGELFVTSITKNDIYNSKGVRITDPVLILMQDRANVHRFGNPDGDQVDRFFSSAKNRSRIRSYLSRGVFPGDVMADIAKGRGRKFRILIYKNNEDKDCVNVGFFDALTDVISKGGGGVIGDDELPVGMACEFIDSESNVREGPGVNYAIVRKSVKGEQAEVADEKSSWVQLRFLDRSYGWVHRKNIRLSAKP